MSNNMQNIPCAQWTEKLAALHPNDLSADEQDELRTHLASCSGCAQTQRDYRHLASLVQNIAVAEAPPDLLFGPGDTGLRSIPISQPGVTSSLPPKHTPRQRPWKVSMLALVGIAAMLVISMLVGSFAFKTQSPIFGPIARPHSSSVYYIGGSPTSVTPQVNPGGPIILASPTPLFFLNGNIYRDNNVYRADTGALIPQYFKELGNVGVYDPKLADGILYTVVSTPDPQGKPGKESMYALRASNRTVLWKWDNCGESFNMTSPIIANGSVYFMCEATPDLYKLYALNAKTGMLVWVNTSSGPTALDLQVVQHTLYTHSANQLLAVSTDTGKLLWKQSFGVSDDYIDWMALDNGTLYIAQNKIFFALQASNGAHLWEYHFTGDSFGPRPFVDQGVVYLFVRQMSGPTTIYALDGITGIQHWHKPISGGSYGFPVVDHGNLYMAMNVSTTSGQTGFTRHFKRVLLAIQGSDGRTLWQQDIPWNKGTLTYTTNSPPHVSVGDGRVYLVDWLSSDMLHLTATMGAFKTSNGTLLWTRDITNDK